MVGAKLSERNPVLFRKRRGVVVDALRIRRGWPTPPAPNSQTAKVTVFGSVCLVATTKCVLKERWQVMSDAREV